MRARRARRVGGPGAASATGRRAARGLAALALAVGALASSPVAPAGAAETFTSSGGAATLTMTGPTASISVQCVAGTLRAGPLVASPPIACTSVTSLTITGDAGSQVVDASRLTASTVPSLTTITVGLGGGADHYWESPLPESISMGSEADTLSMGAGAQNVTAGLGGDVGDTLRVAGRDGDDTIAAALTGGTPAAATTHVGFQDPGGVTIHEVRGVRALDIDAGAGDDEVDLSAIGAGGHAVDSLTLAGGPGDDLLVGAQRGTTIWGGPGTNTLRGGAGDDVIFSGSRRDTVVTGAGYDGVRDLAVGPLGGRNLPDLSSDDHWIGYVNGGDAAVRVRVGSVGEAVVTTALARRGRQAVPAAVGSVQVFTQAIGERADRDVLDVVPSPSWNQRLSVGPDAVVDITVPVGVTWTRTAGPGASVVTLAFSDGHRDIVVAAVPRLVGDPVTPTAVHVHGPIADPVRRFAHRALRDLELRYPTPSQVEALRAQVASGARTRGQVVTSLTGTGTYRGLQVDRAFIDVLRRPTDAAGRTYWVERLRTGLVLRRVRANLYGSDEYFNRFGYGDTATYVTAAYQHILGRAPDPTGLAYWVGLIGSGTARGTVADRFLNTPEARTVVLESHFLRFADRLPTATERTTWLARLASSSTDGELALVRMLAASGAYYSLA